MRKNIENYFHANFVVQIIYCARNIFFFLMCKWATTRTQGLIG
jgi:hypothetical protein